MISFRGGPSVAPTLQDFDSISNSDLLQGVPALLKKDRVGEVKVEGMEQ